MKSVSRQFPVIFLLAALLALLAAQSSWGVPQTLLNEHFDKDQQIALQRWPWNVPVVQNPETRWHYNPLNPYYRAEGRIRTNYCWGWQDLYYNNHVLQDEDIHASIWCAYTNRADTQHPRWPGDSLYCLGQNAWAWWGGRAFNLSNAVAGGVSFWIWLDLDQYSRDSLMVALVDRPNYNDWPITHPSRDSIRTRLAFGALRDEQGNFAGLSIFNHGTNDWVYREFQLDDLRMLDRNGNIVDSVSMTGHAHPWLLFIWQTDSIGIAGKGAFVDDVVVTMDDGRYDLIALRLSYGYRVSEDSIFWTNVPPTYLRPTWFKLDWTAGGPPTQTPRFRIKCDMDGNTIYSEQRQVVGGSDSIYSTVTENPWPAIAGDHVVTWTLDADSTVIETSDSNNTQSKSFFVEWTPAPQLSFTRPVEDSTLAPQNLPCQIAFDISDSNEAINRFTYYLSATDDTSGLAANPDHFYDFPVVTYGFNSQQGHYTFDMSLLNYDVETILYIVGLVSDPGLGNTSIVVAPGTIEVALPVSVGNNDPGLPLTLSLAEPYPNPFNGAVTIGYSLPRATAVRLGLFDLAGREVTRLASGQQTSGLHNAVWQPKGGVGAGVYLVRLQTDGRSFLRKLVYTP